MTFFRSFVRSCSDLDGNCNGSRLLKSRFFFIFFVISCFTTLQFKWEILNVPEKIE